MDEKSGAKGTLQEMHAVFSNTALECANIFFSLPCKLHNPFKVIETLNPGFDFILSLAGNSKNYKAISFVGAQKSLLSILLKKCNISMEDARDILGEYSNAFLGMLQDNADFVRHFGFIEQGLPSLFSGGNIFLPFIWGIEGSINIQDNAILYVAFSIRENEPLQKWEGFYPLKVEARSGLIWITFPSFLNLKYFSEIKSEKIMDLISDPSGIVLDLSKVAVMLSTYIGLVVHVGKLALKRKIPISIIVASSNCRQVLESANITKIATIYDSEKEALDALR